MGSRTLKDDQSALLYLVVRVPSILTTHSKPNESAAWEAPRRYYNPRQRTLPMGDCVCVCMYYWVAGRLGQSRPGPRIAQEEVHRPTFFTDTT